MREPLHVEEIEICSSTDQIAVVDEITVRVGEEAGLNDDAMADLAICVSEAVLNAITHGNHERPELKVHVRFERHPDRLRVTVRDQGGGFEAKDVVDPTLPENLLKTGGRGIHLIRALMDYVTVTQLAEGSQLVLEKRIET